MGSPPVGACHRFNGGLRGALRSPRGSQITPQLGREGRNAGPPRPLGRQRVETSELRKIVRKAIAGDEGAAGALFDHYHPRVFAYALSKLRNRSDAEDVASEAFARVLRDIDKFRCISKYGSLMFVIFVCFNNRFDSCYNFFY